jgi:DNA repair exonuclease SbcCD ATPase subunit
MMNALVQSAPSSTASPKEQASRLIGIVTEIQEAAKQADLKVSESESRGWLKNLVTSNRDDLVSTAKSQGRINDLFVRLNQEVIALNTLGYVYLTNVIAEFERQVNEGVKGSDGRIHVLSESGKRVAAAAKEMFSAILDTSRLTQEKIDANAEATEALRTEVGNLVESSLSHSGLIASLQDVSTELQTLTDRLGAVAAQHGDDLKQLNSGLAEAIRHTTEQAESNSRALQHIEHEVESITAATKSIGARTRTIEAAVREVDFDMRGHSTLIANHSELISGTTESISTLMQEQKEAGARLNLLVESNTTLEKTMAALLAQMARINADHAAEKSRLQRTTRIIGATMLLLALTCIALALHTWHPV